LTPFVLAIDIGTTSTKALAVLSNGEVLGSHQSFYPTTYPKPGYAEQNPLQILEAVKEVVNDVLSHITETYTLNGICFSSAMHSLMAVAIDGKPLSPLIIWADTRSKVQAAHLRNTDLGRLLHDQTGTAIHPMSPLCKLLWWKEHEPDQFHLTHKFISIKEFVIHHLCGAFLIDHSLASATGLFNIDTLTWSNEALQLTGLTADKLSEPVSIYHNSKIKSLKDLHPSAMGVDIFMGGSDGCLAQLGSDAMRDGDMTITLGTSGAVRRVAGKHIKDDERKLFRYLLDPDVLIVGGASNNGTVIMDWFGREFLSSSNLSELGKIALEAPAGCDGLIALPYLLGERAPIYNPDARGVFFNITLTHTRAHFVRALIEGICFEILSIVKSVEASCGPSDKVLISGGFTHSLEWVQMLSNILGKELTLSGEYDASAMGAAATAFKALDIPFTLNRADRSVFSPDHAVTNLYQRQFKHFKKLYHQLESQFGQVDSGMGDKS
jgi:gluconokinase